MTILELHHWFAKKNNVVWFHEISLISRGQFNSFRSIQICDSINSDGATFALSHNGYGACGIPDGETLVLTGGLVHNYVTR